jgi:RNA polymerase sigma factor (sigma-70 family)
MPRMWCRKPICVSSVAPEALAVASDLAAQGSDLAVPSPEQDAIAGAESSDLLSVLESLPPQLREVIVLRELRDLSYRDIAEIIGAPEGTVMSRLARARAELRRRWLKRER